MSTFINAMLKNKGRKLGENGAVEHESTSFMDDEAAQVDLFFFLVRGVSNERITELFKTAADKISHVDELVRLIVLVFQTRNCRGGKGEKDLFYRMFLELYQHYPQTSLLLLDLIPHFGYYKDYLRMIECINSKAVDETTDDSKDYGPLVDSILCKLADQLKADKVALDAATSTDNLVGNSAPPKISLCAKFVPRENKHFASGVNKVCFLTLVDKMFPFKAKNAEPPGSESHRKHHSLGKYRKLIAGLSKALDVTEIYMCAKKFEEINFSRVPSLCMNRCRKAFLNELVKSKVKLTSEQEETGNRHPNDLGRVAARKHLREKVVSGAICGKQLMPHELVAQLMKKNKGVSTLESDLYDAQWGKIRESVLQSFENRLGDGSLNSDSVNDSLRVDLGKVVPLVDVSGSMNGTPMEVAIALGILVSEINHPSFRNHFITFETDPQWVDLTGLNSLQEKVQKTQNSPWGGSTDFLKAITLILDIAESAKLPHTDIPDLIVFSDMQFNEAGGRGDRNKEKMATHLEIMREKFEVAGKRICGESYPLPRIIFWNLRGDTFGVPAQANDPNVQLLSGFSPSLLKLILDGEAIEEPEPSLDGKTNPQKTGPTPLDTYQKAVDDVLYDPVRAILSLSKEGRLAEYTFVPPTIIEGVETEAEAETETVEAMNKKMKIV